MMSPSPLKFYLWSIALTAVIISGCSSSSDTVEDQALQEAELAMNDDALPAADEVGSIPEDDPFAELQNASDDLSGSNNDPFADLEDGSNSESSMADSMNAPSGGSGQMATYVVKSGDTLMKIAFSLYGDLNRWRDLRKWNAATVGNGNNLNAGTSLQYRDEGGFVRPQLDYSYLIRKGDTLGGIAKDLYGQVLKYRKLQRFNPRLIRDPNRIYAGFTLYYNITPEEQREAEAARMQIGSASPSIPSAEPMEATGKPIAIAPTAPSAQ